jgi:hypothetical protein
MFLGKTKYIVFARSEATNQSSLDGLKDGLLRFAGNDGT